MRILIAKTPPIRVELNLKRVHATLILTACLVGAIAFSLNSDTVTISTSLPAPLAVYQSMVTTGGNASTPVNTFLARDVGNVLIGGNNAAIQVGIGTASPASALSVVGSVQPGDDASACSAAKAGALRYHAGQLQICSSGAWINVAQNTPTVHQDYEASCSLKSSDVLQCSGDYYPIEQAATEGPVAVASDAPGILYFWAVGRQCAWAASPITAGYVPPYYVVWQCL